MVYLGKQVAKKKKSQCRPRCFFCSSVLAFGARWRCRITRICSTRSTTLHELQCELPGARRARWDGKRSTGGPQRRRWLRRGSKGQHCTSFSETAREGIGGKYGVADPPDPAAGRVGVGDGRMVLRPPPEHLRERTSPLPVAAAALPPVHALHGERLPSVSPLFSILQSLSAHLCVSVFSSLFTNLSVFPLSIILVLLAHLSISSTQVICLFPISFHLSYGGSVVMENLAMSGNFLTGISRPGNVKEMHAVYFCSVMLSFVIFHCDGALRSVC